MKKLENVVLGKEFVVENFVKIQKQHVKQLENQFK